MVAKKLPFNQMSDRQCTQPGCKKFIKQRLVDKDLTGTKFTLCYKDYRSLRLAHALHNKENRNHV